MTKKIEKNIKALKPEKVPETVKIIKIKKIKGEEKASETVKTVKIMDNKRNAKRHVPEESQKLPTYLYFDNSTYHWKPTIDYRAHPDLYRVGKGEQGVLICKPYKAEIGQYWRFKTPEIAEESSKKIYELFLNYLKEDDFVGADMARKYLQMGYTRARRYCNYKSGRKYDENYQQKERGTGEEQKGVAARVFFGVWKEAEANEDYKKRKAEWKQQYG